MTAMENTDVNTWLVHYNTQFKQNAVSKTSQDAYICRWNETKRPDSDSFSKKKRVHIS
jgi:hypothetical protein